PRLRLPTPPPAARSRLDRQTPQTRPGGVDQPQRAHLHPPTTRQPRPAPRPHTQPTQRHRTRPRLPALRNGLAHRHLHDPRTNQTATPTTREANTATTTRRRHPTLLSRAPSA